MIKYAILFGSLAILTLIGTPAMSSTSYAIQRQSNVSAEMDPQSTPSILVAIWSPGDGADGPYITNGSTTIRMKSYKKARRTAKRFNKIESKENNKKGFKTEETGPCADPNSGIRC